MRAWAYGPLAFQDDRWLRLTPAEFEWLCRGSEWRNERHWDELVLLLDSIGSAFGSPPGGANARRLRMRKMLGNRDVGETKVPGYEGLG